MILTSLAEMNSTMNLNVMIFLIWCITTAIGGGLAGTLEITDQQLDSLTNRVSILSEKLDAITNGLELSDFHSERLSTNLDLNEGKRGACKKGFFPCGPGPDGGVQCVRDYLVCDRSEDCKNGADEAADICKRLPFTKPVAMKGFIIKYSCRIFATEPDNFSFKPVNVNVDDAQIIPWLPSRPQLTWMTSYPGVEGNDAARLNNGVYDYATGHYMFDYFPKIPIYGHCRPDQLNPGELRYVCESDWRRLDEGEPMCGATVVTAVNA